MDAKNLPACVVVDICSLTIKLWKTRQHYHFFTPGWMQIGRLEVIVRSKE